MRPRYIQFRDIHDRDLSGLHCNWVTSGMHTLVYFTAQAPLRMRETPPDGHVQLDIIFRAKFIYWYGEFHTLILKIHDLYTDSYIWITIHHWVLYMNQVLESIVP